ncbi:MAG TPA: methyltransferase domain-containing protein [Holophagaceae bacterium]|nr:methyltransferase domain-containing protein [Holophagaceae bacterium]
MAWDPGLYLRFSDLRMRPAVELLARVDLESPARIVDLGCGTGTSTTLLRARWPEADLEGVDSSAEMLEAAAAGATKARWTRADLASWSPTGPVDLLFANASLQWVGDHESLFPRLASRLVLGGVLAVQMPANHAEPSHALIREVASTGPWRERFVGFEPWHPPLSPRRLYELLAPLALQLDQWDTVYQQVMDGPAAILAWVRATALRPYLDRLEPEARAAFEGEYLARLTSAYPDLKGGHTPFPFRRRFLVLKRPGGSQAPLPPG